ncbi:Na+/H+ antiporter subunit E [Falsiroseomonas sp. HC035]|uniref:Na+/H+ antiporter subunit E n=1 Tax=Falsiroseomonas sp. HC035 TaxID=3390999 RepID=UPI003D314425
MTRLLPYPLLWLALVVMWLLLVGSVAPRSILMGSLAAFGACWALVALRPPQARLRRPRAMAQLAWVVLVEIVRSNNAVARIVLRGRPREVPRQSGFVLVPLDLRDPYGLAVLGCIITATPGTVWVEYDSARSTMLLHVLDLIPDDDWVHIIKDRYESRLREIFE